MRYTVTEFRKNIREILDTADRGEEIVIERYDKTYSIRPIGIENVAEGDWKLTDPKLFVSTAVPKNVMIAVADSKDMKKAVRTEFTAADRCPHGYAKGFCKKADCNRKYKK